MKTKKHLTIIVLALALLVIPNAVQAQIYISEDVEEYPTPRMQQDVWEGIFVPIEGHEFEQYVPLGNGALWLVGLGASYFLLKKRRKEEKS